MCRGRGKEGKSVYFYSGFKKREDGRPEFGVCLYFKMKKKISVISLLKSCPFSFELPRHIMFLGICVCVNGQEKYTELTTEY